MQMWLAADPAFFHGTGQSSRQLIELLAAFLLTALIGLEREIQGKSAGLRTQTIVGTSAALIILISKYGFGDVLTVGTIVLDPSRVAAQVVSGIGFLGAGLIITRRGAVHGLTTAAAIWECAAIGMAAGSGLLLLAVAVTVLHFVIYSRLRSTGVATDQTVERHDSSACGVSGPGRRPAPDPQCVRTARMASHISGDRARIRRSRRRTTGARRRGGRDDGFRHGSPARNPGAGDGRWRQFGPTTRRRRHRVITGVHPTVRRMRRAGTRRRPQRPDGS